MDPQLLNLIFLAVMFGLLWLMVIRPQQQQAKKRQAMLASLKEGDKVITIGGIHGTIRSLTEKEVVLRIAPGVDITVQRSAIGSVRNEESR